MPHEVSISSIGPATIAPDANIYGKVTLVWPYSSSTESFAILLGAVDIRVRSQQGQIRIRFTGPAAKQVAECKVGIADELRISLDGARWREETEARTPGKNVHGELVFRNRLHLEVVNGGAEKVLHIDVDQDEELPKTSTPVTPRKQVLQLLLGPDAVEDLDKSIHQSPVFRSNQKPTLYEDNPSESDALDDEDSRKRSRISFGKVKEWRVSQRSPSPVRSTSTKQGVPSVRASVRNHAHPADEAVTNDDAGTLPALTISALPRELPSDQTRLAPSPGGLQHATQARSPPQASLSAVLNSASDSISTRITNPVAAASNTKDHASIQRVTATTLTPTNPATATHDIQQSSIITPTVPRSIDSSVMTSLFGAQPPANIHEQVSATETPHGQKLSDFDIAAMNFSDHDVDGNAPTRASEQGSVTSVDRLSSEESSSGELPPGYLWSAAWQQGFGDIQKFFATVAEASEHSGEDVKIRRFAADMSWFPPEDVVNPAIQANRGLLTDFGYYSRLGSLGRQLNITNYNGGCKVDVLAAVSRSTSAPRQLDRGPRDYFTSLDIQDRSIDEDVRVDLYRPYETSLPQAEVGDVVLLRAFTVKTHRHKCFLQSNDESAWCIWRFGRGQDAADRGRPDAGPLEEMSGPPVEYGDEERREAWKLQDWFLSFKESVPNSPSSIGRSEQP